MVVDPWLKWAGDLTQQNWNDSGTMNSWLYESGTETEMRIQSRKENTKLCSGIIKVMRVGIGKPL